MRFEVLADPGPTSDDAVPDVLDPTAARGVISLAPQGAVRRQMRREFATVQPGKTEVWTIQNDSGGWFEDHDMMTQFCVGADTPDLDPIRAAPATDRPED